MKEELTTASRELAELELENARLEEVLKTKEVQKTKEELAKAMSRLEEVRQRNTSLRQKLEQDRDEEPSSKEGETRTVSVTATIIYTNSHSYYVSFAERQLICQAESSHLYSCR